MERLVELYGPAKTALYTDTILKYDAESVSIRPKNNEVSVEDALESLPHGIPEFNDEVELCAQLRMERMEETGQTIKSLLESVREAVSDFRRQTRR